MYTATGSIIRSEYTVHAFIFLGKQLYAAIKQVTIGGNRNKRVQSTRYVTCTVPGTDVQRAQQQSVGHAVHGAVDTGHCHQIQTPALTCGLELDSAWTATEAARSADLAQPPQLLPRRRTVAAGLSTCLPESEMLPFLCNVQCSTAACHGAVWSSPEAGAASPDHLPALLRLVRHGGLHPPLASARSGSSNQRQDNGRQL